MKELTQASGFPDSSAEEPLLIARAYVARVEGGLRRGFVKKVAEWLGKFTTVQDIERIKAPRFIIAFLKTRLSRNVPRATVYAAESQKNSGSRALLVTHDLSASGAPKIIFEVARILLASGWRVLVLSPVDGPFRIRLIEAGAHVLVCDTALTRESAAVVAMAGVSDVAICNTIVSFEAIRTLSARVRSFWYLHEISLLVDMLQRHMEITRILAMPERIWTGSEASAALVRRYQPTVLVLPYGVEPLQTSGAQVSRDPVLTVIGLFGSYEQRKGQDLAVAALRYLSPLERASVKLLVHGRVLEPAFALQLQHDATDLPCVQIGRELDEKTYSDILLNCDAVLVSSRDDTLPLVSLDALGAGKPLMCTPTTGTANYLIDGFNGFVASAADARGIAAMLTSALARRAEWGSIGAAGRSVFDEFFSKAAFAKRLINELEDSNKSASEPEAGAG